MEMLLQKIWIEVLDLNMLKLTQKVLHAKHKSLFLFFTTVYGFKLVDLIIQII